MAEVVLDCNVVYSGLRLGGTPPARVLQAILSGTHVPVFSQDLLDEYVRVLTRPSALAWHSRPASAVIAFVEDLRSLGRTVVTDPGPPCPDAGDQHLWDLLHTAPDSILVTGETALLQSQHFPGRILSSRQFAERFLEA